MKTRKPTYQELQTRLDAAEPIVEALKRQEVDAVVGKEKITLLLLRGVGEALENSDAGFRAMFELSGVGMIQALSPDFRLTHVNGKFCEMTGYSAAELLAKTLIGMTHPQDRRAAMNGLARILRGQADSWSIEKRLLRADGRVVWVGVQGAALRDVNGRTTRLMVMVSDLTARKQAEEALRDQAAQLRKLTSELARLKKNAARRARKSA